jgi:hypothetical protein
MLGGCLSCGQLQTSSRTRDKYRNKQISNKLTGLVDYATEDDSFNQTLDARTVAITGSTIGATMSALPALSMARSEGDSLQVCSQLPVYTA